MVSMFFPKLSVPNWQKKKKVKIIIMNRSLLIALDFLLNSPQTFSASTIVPKYIQNSYPFLLNRSPCSLLQEYLIHLTCSLSTSSHLSTHYTSTSTPSFPSSLESQWIWGVSLLFKLSPSCSISLIFFITSWNLLH